VKYLATVCAGLRALMIAALAGSAGGAQAQSGADREAARSSTLERVDLHPSVGKRLERAHRIGEKRVSRVRQPHPARPADEELRSEVGFEPLEPRRQRRLRDEERFGCSADALAPRRLDEGCNLVQKHS